MEDILTPAILAIMDKDGIFLTPQDIAPVLNANPNTIRDTAKEHPEQIGYPFTFNGKLMKIPKIPFLQFLGLVDAYFARMKQRSSAGRQP